MKQDDVSVYGKILQLTSYRDFIYQTTGVSKVRKRYDGCECARASKSIKRRELAISSTYNPKSRRSSRFLKKAKNLEFVEKKKQESLYLQERKDMWDLR